jgi:hypothetical protein
LTEGTVRDIRTGRAIGKTRNLTETFVHQVQHLLEQEEDFYVVYGRCQHQEVRKMMDFLNGLAGFPVVYDGQMPSDAVFIFSGSPDELGFTA